MQVLIGKKALSRIEIIERYIRTEIKMPLTALRYVDGLVSFGFSLGQFPRKYKTCLQAQWNKRGYRCAGFRKQWVFVYEIKNNTVIIRDIVPAKLIA